MPGVSAGSWRPLLALLTNTAETELPGLCAFEEALAPNAGEIRFLVLRGGIS